MRAILFIFLQLLILMIINNCLIITYCADSGRKRDKSAYAKSSTSSAKKSKNAKEASSMSGEATEAGLSREEKDLRQRELEDEILNTHYNNWKYGSYDWKRTFAILSAKHPHLSSFKGTQNRVYKSVRKLLHAAPAWGEGNILWTKDMKSEILRIYYQTRGGNESEHARKMYIKWRDECSNFPDISPRDLLHQAENMLINNYLLDPPRNISKERLMKIDSDSAFTFNPEQEAILRKIYMKMLSFGPIRIDSFYDELCRRYPPFYRASPQKILGKIMCMKRIDETQQQNFQDEADEETDSLSKQDKHHHFYEFMGVHDNQLIHSQSVHHHVKEIGSSSLHQESSHRLDLNLRLGSATKGTPRIHHSQSDLELGSSSQKEKDKLI